MPTTNKTAKTPLMVEREQAQLRAAKELRQNADKIVAAVDKSDFCRCHTQAREFPVFEKHELTAGPVLGVGAFCVVFEVSDILLNGQKAAAATKIEGSTTTAAAAATGSSRGVTFTERSSSEEDEQHERQLENHYNIDEARNLMVANQRRDGTDARYAIKRLHRDLSELERARGIIDLAIETKILSRLWHPNISKWESARLVILRRLFQFVLTNCGLNYHQQSNVTFSQNARLFCRTATRSSHLYCLGSSIRNAGSKDSTLE